MPHQFRMREHHHIFGLRQFAVLRHNHEVTESPQEVAFCRRTQERRGDAFTHDVAYDHIEGLIGVPEKDVKIAVDALRGNGECGHPNSWNIQGRLIEQQGLLDFESDVDLMLPGLFQFLVDGLELGGSCNDALF